MPIITKKRLRLTSTKILAKYGACNEAMKWVGARTPAKAWNECPRGDHLLWLAAKVGVDRKLVVLAACQCARLSLKHVPAGELRPLKAIETAEAWTRGEATIDEVREAAVAADAAAYAAAAAAYAAAAATAAAAAAYGAADAAAAYGAADAADAAAYAADAAADAAAYAAYDARTSTLKECADLVRSLIPFDLVRNAINK